MVMCGACRAKKPEHQIRYLIDDTATGVRHYACNIRCMASLSVRLRQAAAFRERPSMGAYTGATPSLPDQMTPYNAEVYGSKDIGGRRIG